MFIQTSKSIAHVFFINHVLYIFFFILFILLMIFIITFLVVFKIMIK